MNKIYREVPCTEVGKNPEHRYPEKHGFYYTNTGIYQYTSHFATDCWLDDGDEIHVDYWLEEIVIPEDVRQGVKDLINEMDANAFRHGESLDFEEIADTLISHGYIKASESPSLEEMLSSLPLGGYDICPPISENEGWWIFTNDGDFEGSTLTEAVQKYFNHLNKKA